jgi:hypothetical protein
MKTIRSPHHGLTATAFLFLATACLPALTLNAKNSRARAPQLVSTFARENSTSELATEALATTPDAWQNIQNHSYEKRQEFTAVFSRMVAKLDDDIRVLNEKRATMKNDTRDWDFAMKELNNARADVQSKVTDLSRVITADAWIEARDRLGVAWDRAQTAVQTVKSSTTS